MEEKAIENGNNFHGDKIHKKKRPKLEEEDEVRNQKKRKKKEKKERKGKEIPTISIAVAGSIIDNAQSLELATRVCAQSQNPPFFRVLLLFAP